VFCHSCGHENPGDAKFCSNCGHALARQHDDATITFTALDLGQQEEEELAEQVQELQHGDAMLVVKRGANVGSTYLLDNDVVRAGRHPDNEIFLDDVTVSRRHAEFHRDGGQYTLKDLGSLNGTYVNGDRADTLTLSAGDEVQIGAFKLVFLTGSTDR
jgi:pSer/pThr/pTyr-binding forkhead associated (FHA) protein